MKNIVLSYVYNILPESEREIYDAIKLSTVDEEAAPAEETEIDDKNDSSNNKEEEKKLLEDVYQDRIAWGIYNGIIDYFYQ